MNMFFTISRIFFLSSLLAPLWLVRSSFFPFISVKVIYFRSVVELALFFLVVAVVLSEKPKEILKNYYLRLKNKLVISALLFSTFAFVTAFTGIYPATSIWSNFERGDGAFQILHYIIFFVLAVIFLDNKMQRRIALITHVGVSVLTSFYALAQLTLDSSVFRWVVAAGVRVSGTLGNPSYLAAYLLFTLAIIVYLFKDTRSWWWKSFLGAIFLFELFILLKTGTRGAFLGIIVAILILLGANLIISKNKKVKMVLAVLLALPLILMTLFFSNPQADAWGKLPIFGRLIDFTSATSDIKPRIWTWESALSSTLERPILGWGLENFAEPFDSYYNPKHFGIESFFDRTHNIFLEYTVSGGILLLGTWLAMFFFFYRELFRRKKDWWWTVLFAMPVAYLTQGFFLFDVLAIYLVMFLFFAIFLNSEIETKPTKKRVRELDFSSVSIIIIALVVLGTSLYVTDWRVFEKNSLIARSLMLDQITIATPIRTAKDIQELLGKIDEVDKAYDAAYKYKSVVGQGETINSLMKFTLAIEEKLHQFPELVNYEPVRTSLKSLVDKSNLWSSVNVNQTPGSRDEFLVAVINIQFALAPTADGKAMQVVDEEHLALGKAMLEKSYQQYPTRIEFVRVLLRVSQLSGDETGYEKWLKIATRLRPDIDWKVAR